MSDSTVAAATFSVVEPGRGDTGVLAPGVGVVFKFAGDATGGALAMVEHPFEVGALVPPHVHTREDEFSIVLEGEIGFRSEDKEVVLGPGGYIVKPRGEVHAMWNAGGVPARMIEVISPSGFENCFREMVEMVKRGAAEPTAVVELCGRYGLTLEQPEWLPGVIGRYGLTPPPGP
jgi:quercetin dioxygenase-like cupin family protein